MAYTRVKYPLFSGDNKQEITRARARALQLARRWKTTIRKLQGCESESDLERERVGGVFRRWSGSFKDRECDYRTLRGRGPLSARLYACSGFDVFIGTE